MLCLLVIDYKRYDLLDIKPKAWAFPKLCVTAYNPLTGEEAMTTQSDLKKLAEQMAGSMKSFDDIKDFQKQLMQSFIDTALEAEM